MPLEDWLSQIQNRFHAFYADAIGLNLLMLPETVGLFYLVYTPAKGYFPPRERLDQSLKMANYYVPFYQCGSSWFVTSYQNHFMNQFICESLQCLAEKRYSYSTFSH